jgi:pimeloyl-ACP methyl ester carboxylesterase
MFRTRDYSSIPVYDTVDSIDIFYIDNKSDTDIIYCHGSMISGKVYKKLIKEMSDKTSFNVLTFNLRGMFNKRGVSSEKGIRSEIDNLTEYLNLRDKKHIVFGQSLGCCLAIQLCTMMSVKKCILENPFINYRNIVNTKCFWKYFQWLMVDTWDNTDIKKMKDVLFLLSDRDTFVDNSDGLKMSKMVKNGRIETLKGSTHLNSALNKKYYSYINKFIEDT